MYMDMAFTFGDVVTKVFLEDELPLLSCITDGACLLVCDENTEPIARAIAGGANNGGNAPILALKAGEGAKNWRSVETVLNAAKEAGLGRDGVFIGVGGGVVTDIAAFAASVYMRGAGLALVSTSLLGMADAAVGGKTGFDLFGVKNLVGTFYPSPLVFMPLNVLSSLPLSEWKSGMAEIIKTAVIAGEDAPISGAPTDADFLSRLEGLQSVFSAPDFPVNVTRDLRLMALLAECLTASVTIKGRIVEADPEECGGERALLNLGHTFAHALETACGLGTLTHGEAVAWGLVRACDLGIALGITPLARAERIARLLDGFGYETRAPYPLADQELFAAALMSDKKKKNGAISFIVPDETGCRSVPLDAHDLSLIQNITAGGYSS